MKVACSQWLIWLFFFSADDISCDAADRIIGYNLLQQKNAAVYIIAGQEMLGITATCELITRKV